MKRNAERSGQVRTSTKRNTERSGQVRTSMKRNAERSGQVCTSTRRNVGAEIAGCYSRPRTHHQRILGGYRTTKPPFIPGGVPPHPRPIMTGFSVLPVQDPAIRMAPDFSPSSPRRWGMTPHTP